LLELFIVAKGRRKERCYSEGGENFSLHHEERALQLGQNQIVAPRRQSKEKKREKVAGPRKEGKE